MALGRNRSHDGAAGHSPYAFIVPPRCRARVRARSPPAQLSRASRAATHVARPCLRATQAALTRSPTAPVALTDRTGRAHRVAVQAALSACPGRAARAKVASSAGVRSGNAGHALLAYTRGHGSQGWGKSELCRGCWPPGPHQPPAAFHLPSPSHVLRMRFFLRRYSQLTCSGCGSS